MILVELGQRVEVFDQGATVADGCQQAAGLVEATVSRLQSDGAERAGLNAEVNVELGLGW